MKRIGTSLILLLPLLLASCGETSYLGEYSFQMGKQSGSHVKAAMTLSEGEYKDEEGKTVLGKPMVFYVEAQMGKKKSSSSSSSEPIASSEVISSEPIASSEVISSETSAVSTSGDTDIEDVPDDFLDMFGDLLSEGISVNGYYTIDTDTLADGTHHMALGFDIASLFKDEEIQGLNLEPEVVEKIIYSRIDDKSVHLSIPVSIDDVFFQLYWYGFDVWNLADVTPHPLNTHPTEEDVAEINKTFPAAHKDTPFRDFHCLSLGLKKQ